MPYQFFDCRVEDVIDESDLVKRFFIRFPDEIPFSFKSGQFVMLDLPIQSKVTNRAYSIASAPSEDNIFELAIVINPDGIGSPYIFEHIKKNSVVKCTKALGKFGLPETIDDDLCLVCTGTGIAPLRSMTLDIYNRNLPHKNIFLVFGNRWTKDILYRLEMESLEKKFPGFQFLPVLSRDNPGWTGKKGYVHPIYEELFSDKRPAHFYICGWPDMIREARSRIEAMGYDRKRIRFELYD
jgi:ferredoxin-NADP reductase